ncbi:MAG: DJ-1/PfpI family protein [Synergistetes bacterium]|nr:DJ-1/PfpI family protein [Synergistota bacterium]MDK2872201.1 protease [bacterium]
MGKRILELVGDFVEDYEAMVPYQMLLMLGYQVDTTCPGKKPGEKVKTAIHDFEGDQTYSEKPGHFFMITKDFDTIKVEDYDGLVIPGGRAPEYLRMNPKVVELVKKFAEAKKPIAAICHGPQLLTAAKVISGKRICAYPAVAAEIELAGGTYVPPNETFSNAVVDDIFVTAPAWPAHPEWIRKFVELLGAKIEI